MNRPITSTETETVTKKNLPQNESLGPDDFKDAFYQIFRDKLMSISHFK